MNGYTGIDIGYRRERKLDQLQFGKGGATLHHCLHSNCPVQDIDVVGRNPMDEEALQTAIRASIRKMLSFWESLPHSLRRRLFNPIQFL